MRRTRQTKIMMTFFYIMIAVAIIATTLSLIGNILSVHREMQQELKSRNRTKPPH